jgi:hypothetical protein
MIPMVTTIVVCRSTTLHDLRNGTTLTGSQASVTTAAIALSSSSRRTGFVSHAVASPLRDCVIGGPGAFMIPVREKAQFAEAIRTKVVREIADAPRVPSLIQPAQADQRANCLAGELRRQQRSGN